MWAKTLAWRGALAVGVFALITLWLAVEGKLGFYIHPRYNIFTIVMAALGLVLLVIAFWDRGSAIHNHGTRARTSGSGETVSFAFVVVVLGAALVLPPATLSAATADNRSSETRAGEAAEVDSSEIAAGFENLTVRDWASILVQTDDPSFYRGKTVSVIGMVRESGSPNVFLLTRFVVTCCAVDAQPVSIPVYWENWESEVSPEDWIALEGGFVPVDGAVVPGGLAVVPTDVSPEEVPLEPYLF